MGYGTITVVNSAVRVVEGNVKRSSIILTNEGPVDVYIGSDASVTSGTGTNAGVLLTVNTYLTEDWGSKQMWQGDYWAISSNLTSSAVSYWEREGR